MLWKYEYEVKLPDGSSKKHQHWTRKSNVQGLLVSVMPSHHKHYEERGLPQKKFIVSVRNEYASLSEARRAYDAYIQHTASHERYSAVPAVRLVRKKSWFRTDDYGYEEDFEQPLVLDTSKWTDAMWKAIDRVRNKRELASHFADGKHDIEEQERGRTVLWACVTCGLQEEELA
jgi:DNA-binding transcriptional MerR regulator